VNLTWPDLVIGAIAILFAVKGYRKGFVSELAGAVALFIAIIAALRYPGTFDGPVASLTGLGPGSAHVVAMVAFAVAVYIVVIAIAWVLGHFARLPLVGIGNAIAGALVGAGKVLVVSWAILYVALFFPLSRDLRDDLRRSTMVQLVTQPNAEVDDTVRGLLPWFIRPFMIPLFDHHHL
jgi:uncharacterized membrane protein required for colicin V production